MSISIVKEIDVPSKTRIRKIAILRFATSMMSIPSRNKTILKDSEDTHWGVVINDEYLLHYHLIGDRWQVN